MKCSFVGRLVSCCLFLFLSLSAFAQADEAHAERAYDYFAAGQGDSLYAMCTPTMQEKVTPAVLGGMMAQLEAQFGKLQSHGTWERHEAGGFVLYLMPMQFEKYAMRMQFTLDAEGRLAGLFVQPAAAPAASAPLCDDDEVLQRDIMVTTGDFKMPGTLALPKKALAGGHKVPCVVLVHGSGPNDRDETVGPNKPFRDMACLLAGQGIATLRYDKRTRVYGARIVPEGREVDIDTEVTDDVLSAINLAAAQPEVAADSIWVLGHSLGGTLAPRIAQRAEDRLAGIVILAGLARHFGDAVLEQSAYLASLTPSTAETDAKLAELKRQVENVKKLGTEAFDDSIPLPLNMPRTYWLSLNAYDAVQTVATLSLPVLVLQGERDYQVTMQDFGMWRMALLRKKNAAFQSYPKLNHLLQEGTGESTPFEYQSASPVPAYVAADIAAFMRGASLPER